MERERTIKSREKGKKAGKESTHIESAGGRGEASKRAGSARNSGCRDIGRRNRQGRVKLAGISHSRSFRRYFLVDWLVGWMLKQVKRKKEKEGGVLLGSTNLGFWSVTAIELDSLLSTGFGVADARSFPGHVALT